MEQAAASLRVISGGQTGVDRAALDVAMDLDLGHGGWCPLGRRAEDGKIDRKYALRETESPDYAVRTERNVIDSDGTLIIFQHTLRGGTEFTYRMAAKHQKPHLLIDLAAKKSINARQFRKWLEQYEIVTLNVAGPRESSLPGVYRRSKQLLHALLRSLTHR
jgi:hypothetical protein